MSAEPRYFIAPDGDGEPTLWDRTPDPWNDTEPLALVRRYDVSPEAWAWVLDHQQPPTVPPPRLGSIWCADCGARRPVVDAFTSGHLERRGEVTYGVHLLDCGHSSEGPATVTAAAPGAPYAGDRAVASCARTRDLLDASKRQQLRDLIQSEG